MTNSTVSPNTVIKSNGKIFLVDKSSISENEIDGIKNYTYEMYELPISDRDNLNEYVESNYDVLLEFAIRESLKSIPMTDNDMIWDTLTYILMPNKI